MPLGQEPPCHPTSIKLPTGTGVAPGCRSPSAPVIFQCWTQSGTLGHVGQTSRFYLWEVSVAQNDPGTWCVSSVSEGKRKAQAGETSSPVREVCLGTQA